MESREKQDRLELRTTADGREIRTQKTGLGSCEGKKKQLRGCKLLDRGGSSERSEGGIKKSEERRQSRAEVKEGKMK